MSELNEYVRANACGTQSGHVELDQFLAREGQQWCCALNAGLGAGESRLQIPLSHEAHWVILVGESVLLNYLRAAWTKCGEKLVCCPQKKLGR